MMRTQFSHLTTEELLAFALGRDTRTDLEVELAQRLTVAVDALEEESPAVRPALHVVHA